MIAQVSLYPPCAIIEIEIEILSRGRGKTYWALAELSLFWLLERHGCYCSILQDSNVFQFRQSDEGDRVTLRRNAMSMEKKRGGADFWLQRGRKK